MSMHSVREEKDTDITIKSFVIEDDNVILRAAIKSPTYSITESKKIGITTVNIIDTDIIVIEKDIIVPVSIIKNILDRLK